MRHMRGMKLVAALAAGLLALGACGDSDDDDSSSGSDTKVGLAYDIGGRGDRSFNDSAAAGLDRAKDELDIQAQEVSPNQQGTDRGEKLKQLVENGFNPVIAVGFKYAEDVKEAATGNPDTTFAIVDDDTAKGDNIVNILFAEEQGSYLVGMAAALKSKAKHVGFIGGVQSELIGKFEAGFKAGVQSVDPNMQIDINYLSAPPDFSGFAAPDKAKVAANGMIDGGADVIYHAAGNSGPGLFQAAVEARNGGKEVWAIGVDQDQYLTASDAEKQVILTSMIKRVDTGVFEFIQKYTEGDTGGGEQRYDLKTGGVDYATSGGYVDDIEDQLNEAKQKIIDGEIKVPTTP